MPIETSYTDYETDYNTTLQAKSVEDFEKAEKARKGEETEKVDKTVTSNTGPAAKDSNKVHPESVAAYLDFLQIELQNDNIFIGDYAGDSTILSGVGSILVSEKLLQKMVDSPEFGLKMESQIAEMENAERSLITMLNAQGNDILSHGTIIDEYGDSKTWSFLVENVKEQLELESTDEFMKMEELREQAMKLDLERHDEDGYNIRHTHDDKSI